VVTPEGFPLAYEVMEGNTSDKTTLPGFLQKIEQQYGRAERIWIMDRGIPTEEVLEAMRNSATPVSYLVGTPRGRLHKMEKAFADLPWEKARESVEVKLLPQTGELYILARSTGRRAKERSIRQRRLKQLWRRLAELQRQKLTRDELLLKLGAAKTQAGAAYRLVEIQMPGKSEPVTPETFTYVLRKDKLRQARRREGHYLLRSNLCGENPAVLWQYYIQLTQIEQVFKTLKGDLSIRPIYHQKDSRMEAHIFVAFQAYCLQVTLQQRLKALAPGLTPREVLMKLAGLQMVDVHLPTTDARTLILSRYTQPNQDQALLLKQLSLTLPEQPVPRITQSEPATSFQPLRL
jgi:transposase